MPHIPLAVAETNLSRKLAAAGLVRIHQGKVRDTWELPGHPGKRLVVTTDRISAFDFMLGHDVPGKGKALNIVNIHWKRDVISDVPNDLVAAGVEIDQYLPQSLQNDPELQARSVVVDVLEMLLAEFIARRILTGTAWKMYKSGERELWGYPALPDGMKEWEDLPFSMFTPTDKADSGHDEPVTREFVRKHYGEEPEELTIKLYDRGQKHAASRGLIVVDTKFELGRTKEKRILTLGDEVFTPDSSRYLHAETFKEDRRLGRKPQSFDKQIVRDYLMHAVLPNGDVIDVSQLDPKNAAHRDLVATIVLPDKIMEKTIEKYDQLVQMLSGLSPEEYRREELGIAA